MLEILSRGASICVELPAIAFGFSYNFILSLTNVLVNFKSFWESEKAIWGGWVNVAI